MDFVKNNTTTTLPTSTSKVSRRLFVKVGMADKSSRAFLLPNMSRYMAVNSSIAPIAQRTCKKWWLWPQKSKTPGRSRSGNLLPLATAAMANNMNWRLKYGIDTALQSTCDVHWYIRSQYGSVFIKKDAENVPVRIKNLKSIQRCLEAQQAYVDKMATKTHTTT